MITYKNAFSEVHANTFIKNYKGTIVSTISLNDSSTGIDTDLLKLSKEKIDAIFVTDISFFFAGGMDKLKHNKTNVPVFSLYPVELPMARSLVNDVIYSFPEGITGDAGGTYELSKESANTVLSMAINCNGDTKCIKVALANSKLFNDKGVAVRNIILKQIKGEKVLMYK